MTYRRRHGPPPFVRRMGCAFAALIVVAAATSALLGHGVAATVIAVAMALVIVAGFGMTMGRATRFFREQDRLRRQLMADVAHELRTPLSILQGRIEGMLDGVYARDDRQLSELLGETRHLARLVEDVRTLANAEAGALDLQRETVDLGDLIRDTARAFGAGVAIPDDLPSIPADPVRIREVLLNLLTNAEAAGASITVRAEARARDVVIAVHDDGPGIPAEDLPHLFERFHKGAGSRGTGLGLSIARKLVVAHGGAIRIDSRPGAGTTVFVSLPR